MITDELRSIGESYKPGNYVMLHASRIPDIADRIDEEHEKALKDVNPYKLIAQETSLSEQDVRNTISMRLVNASEIGDLEAKVAELREQLKQFEVEYTDLGMVVKCNARNAGQCSFAPTPPDSHEQIIEDSTFPPKYYCQHILKWDYEKLVKSDEATLIEAMAQDLIKRTRAVCEGER